MVTDTNLICSNMGGFARKCSDDTAIFFNKTYAYMVFFEMQYMPIYANPFTLYTAWMQSIFTVTFEHYFCLAFGNHAPVEVNVKWKLASIIHISTLTPGKDGRHLADDIFKRNWKCNENIWFSIKIALKFVPKCAIEN